MLQGSKLVNILITVWAQKLLLGWGCKLSVGILFWLLFNNIFKHSQNMDYTYTLLFTLKKSFDELRSPIYSLKLTSSDFVKLTQDTFKLCQYIISDKIKLYLKKSSPLAVKFRLQITLLKLVEVLCLFVLPVS